MLYETNKDQEVAVLAAVDTGGGNFGAEPSLDELEALAETAGAQVCGRLTQRLDRPTPAHYFGTGKLDELSDLISLHKATTVIFDDELSPAQLRNLSDKLDAKVIDRTALILDIFASRASSAEGKAQVETAQLNYRLSRLVGLGKSMSRLGAGIGTRGPGESKLESDRRHIRLRLDYLKDELKQIAAKRRVVREGRGRTPVVSMVGYTNAGKSTLMNLLTKAGVLAEDKLFATLDTTTRKVVLPGGGEVLFTDTVGFIQKLPTHLIKAFRATLEELNHADILLHVVDSSNPSMSAQIDTVYSTLKNLGCSDKPIITVFNKMDKAGEVFAADPNALCSVRMNAKNGDGMDGLLLSIDEAVKGFKKKMAVLIPFTDGKLAGFARKNCEVTKEEHTEDGVFLELYADAEMQNRLAGYEM
jgi:GTP-binding protein HflX